MFAIRSCLHVIKRLLFIHLPVIDCLHNKNININKGFTIGYTNYILTCTAVGISQIGYHGYARN